MTMKLPVFIISLFFVLLAPASSFAQQGTPGLTVRKLFILLDQPANLINQEDKCYSKWEGMDVLQLNKQFIKKYLENLKNTGLFSSAYLARENQYYQDMQKEISTDGMSSFRDSDQYTLSQDPPSRKTFAATVQKTTPVIKGNKASLTFRAKGDPGYKLVYRLLKENNNWLIDSISSI